MATKKCDQVLSQCSQVGAWAGSRAEIVLALFCFRENKVMCFEEYTIVIPQEAELPSSGC